MGSQQAGQPTTEENLTRLLYSAQKCRQLSIPAGGISEAAVGRSVGHLAGLQAVCLTPLPPAPSPPIRPRSSSPPVIILFRQIVIVQSGVVSADCMGQQLLRDEELQYPV